jgi:hypothetical protein
VFKRILHELKHHAPFTAFGAVTGIAFMVGFRGAPESISYKLFYLFHPLHVLLSALVTASMYRLYKCRQKNQKCNPVFLLLVGYFGSVGIATLSDSVIPYLGEILLKMPRRAPHIGFIEEWWLVNPMALLGITIAYFRPRTKFPHAGHVLLSTWASLAHILMASCGVISWFIYPAIFIFLFLAVWLPCCVSDIVFPLLFVRGVDKKCKFCEKEVIE